MASDINRIKESNRILETIKADNFKIRDHVVRRNDERMLTRKNILNIANTVIERRWQEDKQTHWYIGFLSKEKTGGFTAVVNENNIWVVTVFKRRLSRRERELLSNSSFFR